MTASPELQRLLAVLQADEGVNFASLQEAIYRLKYTGTLTLHFRGGVPRQVDLGAPIRLSIVEGGIDTADRPDPR